MILCLPFITLVIILLSIALYIIRIFHKINHIRVIYTHLFYDGEIVIFSYCLILI